MFVMSDARIGTYSYHCVLQISAKELEYEHETGRMAVPRDGSGCSSS